MALQKSEGLDKRCKGSLGIFGVASGRAKRIYEPPLAFDHTARLNDPTFGRSERIVLPDHAKLSSAQPGAT